MQKIELTEYEQINARETPLSEIRIERPIMVDGRFSRPYSIKAEVDCSGCLNRWFVSAVRSQRLGDVYKWVYTLQ